MARARLSDVADRAGVSTATASLVLRDQEGPSEETRERVRLAAAELGYRPDRTASLLARRRTHLLGVLFDVTSPFHAELVSALDEAAGARGLDLVLSTVTPRRDEASAAELLLDSRCEGLILLGPTLKRPALDALGDRSPTAVVGRRGTGATRGVLASDEIGLALAVDHLVGLGHRRIAHVDGPAGTIAAARRRGYQHAMRRHGLADDVDIIPGGLTEDGGAAAVSSLLERPAHERPTALIAYNDRSAIGARDALMRAGVSVPRDISVIGYDDSPPARLGTVDLTTVSQDPTALARAAIEAILDLTSERAVGSNAKDVVIDPRLVIRSSTGPAVP